MPPRSLPSSPSKAVIPSTMSKFTVSSPIFDVRSMKALDTVAGSPSPSRGGSLVTPDKPTTTLPRNEKGWHLSTRFGQERILRGRAPRGTNLMRRREELRRSKSAGERGRSVWRETGLQSCCSLDHERLTILGDWSTHGTSACRLRRPFGASFRWTGSRRRGGSCKQTRTRV